MLHARGGCAIIVLIIVIIKLMIPSDIIHPQFAQYKFYYLTLILSLSS